MKKYVIIGNGVAAAACIEGIRSQDDSGSITVISEENHPVYCRPLISYYLEDRTDTEKMNYRGPDFYEKNGCRVIYGKKAAAIDPEKKTVTTEDGKTLPYDEMCLAAGSSPFVPPFEGLDSVKDKYGFMTLDDAVTLKAAVNKDSRVLIMGAGLIGLKCAEGLRDCVGEITVCDLADRVLSSILDTECAAIMQRHLEKNGIKFLLSDTAVKFDGNTAYMKSGAVVEYDILVLSVGVRANSGLIKDAGGEVNRGVLVDSRMRSSLPNVYSAGDCAEGDDISIGGKRVLAILPNAYMQGYTAGVNMAGGDRVYDNAFPMNSIGFFGLHAMTAGSYDGDCYEEKDGDRLKRLFTRDDRLIGFILIGYTERTGIYTSLIRDKTPLDSINFEVLKKTATTTAFPGAVRRKKFGGVV